VVFLVVVGAEGNAVGLEWGWDPCPPLRRRSEGL